MRLERMPVAAPLELRRIRAVFFAVEAHDAQEEIIRQPAHRLAVAMSVATSPPLTMPPVCALMSTSETVCPCRAAAMAAMTPAGVPP